MAAAGMLALSYSLRITSFLRRPHLSVSSLTSLLRVLPEEVMLALFIYGFIYYYFVEVNHLCSVIMQVASSVMLLLVLAMHARGAH